MPRAPNLAEQRDLLRPEPSAPPPGQPEGMSHRLGRTLPVTLHLQRKTITPSVGRTPVKVAEEPPDISVLS